MKQARWRDRSPRRNSEAIAFAREQRKQANEFAQHVWQIVRNRKCLGKEFRREYPIPPYTVDFCCVELRLILEVDGASHLTEEGRRHDQRRDRFLADLGFQVLRIAGYETVNDPQRVRKGIVDAINERIAANAPSPPTPLPRKAGGEGSRE